MERLSFLLFVFVALASVKLTVGQSVEELTIDLNKQIMRCEQEVGSSAVENFKLSGLKFGKAMSDFDFQQMDQRDSQEQQLCSQFEAIENAGEAYLASISTCLFEESSVALVMAKKSFIMVQRFARFFCRDQLVVRGEATCLKQKIGEFAKCNYSNTNDGQFGPFQVIRFLNYDADLVSTMANCSRRDQDAECVLEELRTALVCGDGVRQLMSAELKKALDAVPCPAPAPTTDSMPPL